MSRNVFLFPKPSQSSLSFPSSLCSPKFPPSPVLPKTPPAPGVFSHSSLASYCPHGALFASFISDWTLRPPPAEDCSQASHPGWAPHTQAGDAVCVQHLVLGARTLAAPRGCQAQAAAATVVHAAFVGPHCKGMAEGTGRSHIQKGRKWRQDDNHVEEEDMEAWDREGDREDSQTLLQGPQKSEPMIPGESLHP